MVLPPVRTCGTSAETQLGGGLQGLPGSERILYAGWTDMPTTVRSSANSEKKLGSHKQTVPVFCEI